MPSENVVFKDESAADKDEENAKNAEGTEGDV